MPLTTLSCADAPGRHTYIQVVGGAVEQLLGRGVEPVQQDCVSPFAVESNLPLWIPNCERHKGEKCQKISESTLNQPTGADTQAHLLFYVSSAPAPTGLTYDRHPLANVVKVQDGQQLVGDGRTELMDSDCFRGTRAEHKAKVPGCGDQSPLIWRLSFVVQLPCREREQ